MSYYWIVMGALGIALALLLVYMCIKRWRRKHSPSILASTKNTRNYLYPLYRIYRVTPVLKNYFRKLKNKYRAILPADEITLNTITTKRMSLCIGVCILLFAVTCLLSDGDLMFAVAGCLCSYIIFTTLISSSEEQLQMKLLTQQDLFITEVHSYFHDTGRIEDAISSCLDDLPYEIGLHAQKLLSIVNSIDVEAEVENYVDIAPNKFLLLMAAICSSVKEYGDKKLKDGKSIFLNNLNFLKEELGIEKLRFKKKVAAFSGKIIGVLAPLFCIKPLQLYMEHNFPDTQSFYRGFGGAISLAVVIVITFVCYEFMNALKDDKNEIEENRFLTLVCNVPFVKRYLMLYTERNYTKTLRISDDLKAIGDHNGTNVFYVKRILYAIGCAALVVAVTLIGIHRTKEMIVSTWSNSYENTLVPNEEYRQTLQDFSMAYKGKIKDANLEREELCAELMESVKDEQMVNLIADEFLSRSEQLKTYYFKWYVLLLALAGGVAGFFVPWLLLQYKKKIMQLNREEEVARFRTLILILMHQDGMTLDTILEWMERFANTFKPSISDCILNLNYSRVGALEKLKEAESGFAPFRRLVNSLIATDDVGLEGAFDDLEIERNYYQKESEQDNLRLLAKRINKANKIQMVPILALAALYLLLPMGVYVTNTYSQLSAVMPH